MKRERQNKTSVGQPPAGQESARVVLSVLGKQSARGKARVSVPREWAAYQRALLALRDHLLRERGQQLEAGASLLEVHNTHPADSATDELDRDLALAELSAEQEALYEVEEALRRIGNRTYGICELTGKPIPVSRLRAAPWTRFTREAQEQLEADGDVQRAIGLGKLHRVEASLAASFEAAETADEEERTEPAADDETLHVLNELPGRRTRVPKKKAREATGGT